MIVTYKLYRVFFCLLLKNPIQEEEIEMVASENAFVKEVEESNYDVDYLAQQSIELDNNKVYKSM